MDERRPVHLIASDGAHRYRPLTPDQQVALYSRTLHRAAHGHVEVAAARRLPDGKLHFPSKRRDPGDYPAAGDARRLVELASRYRQLGLEVFSTPLTRSEPIAGKSRVRPGRVIWVDLDDVEDDTALGWVDTLRPHLWIASGGGHHAYWLLDRELPCDGIESCNRRLAFALGGDFASCDRGRIMRLPGTMNHRRGRLARIVRLDLSRRAANPERLMARLADPQPPEPPPTLARIGRRLAHLEADDATKIAPPAYFAALAGVAVPDRGGPVRCPLHEERAGSCFVYPTSERGWFCFGCNRGGGIYDLASALEHGPTGRALRGDQFSQVKRRVHEALRLDHTPRPSNAGAGR